MTASSGRLVITGVGGFVGQHLAAAAHDAGWTVLGIGQAHDIPPELAAHLSDYVAADLRTEWPGGLRADAIIHLAGMAAVGPSFDRPQEYIEANSAMVTTMGESLVREGHPVRLVGVSTGAVYAPPHGHALDETSPLAQSSPYVVSKLLTEHQYGYYASRGIDTVIARPFNHIGPGQGPGFLVPDLTRNLLALPADQPLRVGNLATARDYTDVRDVAAAYLLLAGAAHHAHRSYNVASGVSISGNEILKMIAVAADRPMPQLEVDRSRFRANDPATIVGSAQRLRDEFGWAPTITVEQSIREFVATQG